MEFITDGFKVVASGGFIMIIILVMAVIGTFVIINKMFYFNRAEKENLSEKKPALRQALISKDVEGAIDVLGDNEDSGIIVLKSIIRAWNGEENMSIVKLEEKAKEVGIKRIAILEQKMWLLEIVATSTPLLGLFGTVIGMIQAFTAISIHGVGDPSILASGISKALITTAGGLCVAIPALIMYNYLNRKIDFIIQKMEQNSVELINFLRG